MSHSNWVSKLERVREKERDGEGEEREMSLKS